MSYGPTHFRNETIRLVSKALATPHHFTLPYCPWSNGPVKRLGRELLLVLRETLSELQMDNNEWPDLIPIVQSVLDNSPSPQRGNVFPCTAFQGHEPTPPVCTFLRTGTTTPVTVSEAQLESNLNVEKLIKFCAKLHPRVNATLTKNRLQAREHASRGHLSNFEEGDYVLVARPEFHAGEKLCLRWRGSQGVTKALSDYVYQVEDLRNGQLDKVHASRLKMFRDSNLDEVEITSDFLKSETGMVVSRLLSLEENAHGLQFLIHWKALEQK